MSAAGKLRLGDLASISSGGGAPQDAASFSDDGHPFIRAGSLSKLLAGDAEDDLEHIEPESARAHGLKLFPEGTILFAKSGMSATKGLIYCTTKPAYIVNHLAAIRPHMADATRFLIHALHRSSPTKLIRDAAYPSIRLSDIAELEIEGPSSLDEQRRIAAILDKADALRRKRKRALELLDGLPQAWFEQSFGMQAGARTVALGEICDLIRDGTHKTPNYVSTGVPFVTVKNITSGQLDLRSTKFVSQAEHAELTRRAKPESGDLLVSKDGTIGVPCLVPEGKEFSIFVSVALLKLKRDLVSPLFLREQIKSQDVQAQIVESSKGIAIRHLHLNDFARLRIKLPSLADQMAYCDKLDRVWRANAGLRLSSEKLGGLFLSLQHRAFSGQL